MSTNQPKEKRVFVHQIKDILLVYIYIYIWFCRCQEDRKIEDFCLNVVSEQKVIIKLDFSSTIPSSYIHRDLKRYN